MKHIYYRNDFEFRFQIKGADGVAQVPQHRWSVVFSVGDTSFECSIRNKTASVEGDTMVCRLQDHNFGCGELKAILREWRPDEKWLDGYMDISTPIDTDIVLWEGASDSDIGVAVIEPSQGGSSVVRLPMIAITPSPIMKNNDGESAPVDCLKVAGYEEYINQGYSPILMRKLSYKNNRVVNKNEEGHREPNYSKYGWRWRKTFNENARPNFIHLTINSDGLLCNAEGGVISSKSLVNYEVHVNSIDIKNGRNRKTIWLNQSTAVSGSCRLKYGLVFVDFRNKNLEAYKFEEKDFVSNIVRFDIVVGIEDNVIADKYIAKDATTKFSCARD